MLSEVMPINGVSMTSSAMLRSKAVPAAQADSAVLTSAVLISAIYSAIYSAICSVAAEEAAVQETDR